MKTKPQYIKEDVNALEHVTMLIDEYLCCDDFELTESGKALKDLVADFFHQWDEMLRKYAHSKAPKSPKDFVKNIERST